MDGANETLLRQLIAQVTALEGQVAGLSARTAEMGEAYQERRSNEDRRISGLEERVRLIELIGAEGKTMPGMLSDHEKRIRSLENIRWQLLAVAFLGSGLGWVVTNIVLS